MTNKIEVALLRQLLRYEPDTGKLFWLPRPLSMFHAPHYGRIWNDRYATKEALTADNGVGYRIGSIFNRHYLAHRVAWAIVHGEWPDVIDHINQNPSDNRLINLRSVTASENSRNARRQSRNTSGHSGVQLHGSGKWYASISTDNGLKYLGIFSRKCDAVSVRKAAEIEHGYHPNHGQAA